MIAISADPPTLVDSTQHSLQITYLLLSDQDTETIAAYNVIDPSNTVIARPATYIIDQKGRIAWSSLDIRFGDRTGTEQILTELKKM